MKILQQPVKVKRGSRVVISFSQPSNIFLMTEVNYKKYKEGGNFSRLGGQYSKSPVEFTAPYDGTWHAVIEKGSHFSPTHVTGSVEVLSPLSKDTEYFNADLERANDLSKKSATETEYSEDIDVKNEVESEAEQSDSDDKEEDEEKD